MTNHLKKNKTTAVGLLLSSALILGGCATAVPIDGSASRSSSEPSTVIAVGGSAEAYEAIEQLADAYQAKTDTTFDFFPPSQTSSGVEGVKNDTFNIGGMSRKPTDADISGGMTYLPLVVTPLVVVAHESVTEVSNISAAQLKGIYEGEITNWKALGGPDMDIVLFDVSEDESEKQVLRDAYLGADLDITSTAVVFSDDDEMVEAASATEFSFATVPFEDELEELPVTVLSIDDVLPSDETVESGAYKMSLPIGIAISDAPTAETQAFVEFAQSDEGRSLLSEDDDDDD